MSGEPPRDHGPSQRLLGRAVHPLPQASVVKTGELSSWSFSRGFLGATYSLGKITPSTPGAQGCRHLDHHQLFGPRLVLGP